MIKNTYKSAPIFGFVLKYEKSDMFEPQQHNPKKNKQNIRPNPWSHSRRHSHLRRKSRCPNNRRQRNTTRIHKHLHMDTCFRTPVRLLGRNHNNRNPSNDWINHISKPIVLALAIRKSGFRFSRRPNSCRVLEVASKREKRHKAFVDEFGLCNARYSAGLSCNGYSSWLALHCLPCSVTNVPCTAACTLNIPVLHRC